MRIIENSKKSKKFNLKEFKRMSIILCKLSKKYIKNY